MPNIDKINVNGTSYDIKDSISGYTTNTGTVTSVATGTGLSGGPITTSGTISLDTTYALSSSDITTGTDTTNKLVSAKTLSDVLGGLGGGTITGVTAGTGLSGGGTTGGVTLNHSNSVTAQTTQAVYPIKIDSEGHISAYGSAVTIPTVNNANLKFKVGSTEKGTFTANASTDLTLTFSSSSITPVTSNTVVTGGSTTSITPVTSNTVVTSASGATASYSAGVLTLTNGSFSTGASVTSGTAVNAYTSLTTGASVTNGTAVTVLTGLSGS